ncbi:Type 1 glutamine amidotransferase-like domain-containing protein [Clostridium sp.]|uniref:Type 1 glutamine amidotransferase-like domain-containing protein n=1 Tax=Clostridium sp. TaxID=1506 RepID=UPI00321693C6
MKLFLTSSIGGSYKENGIRIPCALDGSNHFLDHIKKYLPENSKCLILSSDPENEEMNDSFKNVFTEAFKISNLSLSKIDVCDRRNENNLADILYDYDIVLLAGGHVPTQNQFFSRINLKELLIGYEGIIIGISAGTMNCADVVYAQPELDGEAIDHQYQRYLEGLNLTRINVLPHFQEMKNLTVDGLRILEDISLPDSKKRPFYALVDGSYIFVDDNKSTLYGEGYWVQSGTITKICDTDKSIELVP